MIGRWLADTWEGSVTKIALGAALGALGSWLATSDVHPLIVAVGAAVVPVLVNALNGADPRYGRQAYIDPEDMAREPELKIEGE